jgi:hypothetical protein
MYNSQSTAQSGSRPYKIVQPKEVPLRELPAWAVSAEMVRTLELELQKKGILRNTPKALFNPVWFMVETERNVFLWRQGCSLIQQDDFEFWVDLQALIEKRLKQLENPDLNNPFQNPLWGNPTSPDLSETEFSENLRLEMDYLSAFAGALNEIVAHAHALSHVSSLISRDLHDGPVKQRVLLPRSP